MTSMPAGETVRKLSLRTKVKRNDASLLSGREAEGLGYEIVDVRIDILSIACGLQVCNDKLLLSFTGRINRRPLRLDEFVPVSERL